MLIATNILLEEARAGRYSIGAFNIYNMEGALAVVEAAEAMDSPVILQLLPSALERGGSTLLALCLETASQAKTAVSVHLDHCPSEEVIQFALKNGISSVMADGSHLPFRENLDFTRRIVDLAQKSGAGVEAELGRLSGEEDGIYSPEADAAMTTPEEARIFALESGADALAVCIGNVHGKYTRPPELDFGRLDAIAASTHIPLVLHGTSGLPEYMITKAISYGVAKFNVNTEVRHRYLEVLHKSGEKKMELVDIIDQSISAMKEVVQDKIVLFGSNSKTRKESNVS